MLNRILYATIAATLLTAAPALAGEDAASQPCSCCSDGSVHENDHAMREGAREKAKPAGDGAASSSTGEDDPFARNQSFGG